jgi:hypothetical protein
VPVCSDLKCRHWAAGKAMNPWQTVLSTLVALPALSVMVLLPYHDRSETSDASKCVAQEVVNIGKSACCALLFVSSLCLDQRLEGTHLPEVPWLA